MMNTNSPASGRLSCICAGDERGSHENASNTIIFDTDGGVFAVLRIRDDSVWQTFQPRPHWITDVAFFNQQEGPYAGSIIQLDGYPPIHKTVGFGRTAGIYYRYFLFDAGPLWTLLVNIGYIAVPLGALSAWIAQKLLVKCKNIS
jgi:hypothetical protein